MLILQRHRGIVVGIIACFLIYDVEARRTRENFDDSLVQRVDDVVNVVLRRGGTLNTDALKFARDLNTSGIDIYLFNPG